MLDGSLLALHAGNHADCGLILVMWCQCAMTRSGSIKSRDHCGCRRGGKSGGATDNAPITQCLDWRSRCSAHTGHLAANAWLYSWIAAMDFFIYWGRLDSLNGGPYPLGKIFMYSLGRESTPLCSYVTGCIQWERHEGMLDKLGKQTEIQLGCQKFHRAGQCNWRLSFDDFAAWGQRNMWWDEG